MKEIPATWAQQMQELLGSEAHCLIRSMDEPPAIAIRLNPRKNSRLACPSQPIPWNPSGYYVADAPFGFDPLWHAGAYYVQEPSSQFVARAIETALSSLETPPRVLDLCAAPGGKSLLIADTLPPGSLLVSNEVVPRRAQKLSENLAKWAHPDVIQTRNEAADFGQRLPAFFNIIAVDAPCSGEGMMRRSPEARAQWSLSLQEQCAALQRTIVTNVWPALQDGGFLIYSTCTFNTLENEQNVQFFTTHLGAQPVEIPLFPHLRSPFGPGYRFFPHKVRGEGFYLVLLRKPGSSSLLTPHSSLLAPHSSLPTSCLSVINYRQELPTQASYEVDYTTALQYLHGDVLRLPPQVPRGSILITHQSLPLGRVNNLGSRANNLYPKQWRLRSTHFPTCQPIVVLINR